MQCDMGDMSESEQYRVMRYKLFQSTGYSPEADTEPEEEETRVLHLMDISGFNQCAGQCVFVDNMAKFLAFDNESQPSLLQQAAHVDSLVTIMIDQPLFAFKTFLGLFGITRSDALFETDDWCVLSTAEASGSREARTGAFGRSLKHWPVSDELWDKVSCCCAQTVFPALGITEADDWVNKGERNFLFIMTLMNKIARRIFGGQGSLMDHKVSGTGVRKLTVAFGPRARELKDCVSKRRVVNTQ